MKKFSVLLLIAMLLTVSCGKDVPDDTIPTDSQSEAITDTQTPETEPVTESATETEPATEAATETEPVTESATETEPATEAATETEPVTEAATETEPVTEATTETEPVTEAATETEPVTEATTETEPVTEAATAAPETEAKAEVPEDDTFLFHQDRIQIGIMMEPGKARNDALHYDQIQKAGITYIQMSNTEIWMNETELEKMMTLCDERKIGVYLNTARINVSVPSLAEKAASSIVEEFKAHPSFVGVLIVDEPRSTEEYAPAYKAIAKQGYSAHLNLFPIGVSSCNNYQGYVEDTVISMGAKNMDYLQFDHYPFQVNNQTSSLFQNMNIYREAGLKYDVDTAFYVQSIGIEKLYREPTGDEIRYHVSTGLAYGFKYMTYFTWCTPRDVSEVYTYAIMDDNGKLTSMYEPVCAINAKVHDVGLILGKVDALKVTLTSGKETGIETADAAAAALHPKGKNVFIVSYMEERGGSQEYVMLVNNSFTKEVTETFTVSKDISALIDCTTGKEIPVDISSGEITLTLAPGDFMLFKLGEGDDFVQVEWDADAKNLAKNKPVAVEKTYTNAFGGSGSYAFCLTDGMKASNRNTARGWHCQANKADIDVDLKRAVTINRVDVYPFGYSRLADYGKLFPRDFDVQVSVDGETWTTVASVTGFDEKKDGIPSLKFAPVEARYVRIHVTKGVKNAFEIAEIEIYNDDGSIPAVKDVHQ